MCETHGVALKGGGDESNIKHNALATRMSQPVATAQSGYLLRYYVHLMGEARAGGGGGERTHSLPAGGENV